MSRAQPEPHAGATTTAAPRFGRRWTICALLLFATTINYVDRQVIGILKPVLGEEFGWSEIDYGNIVFAFQASYALGLLLMGRLLDRLGTRRGYSFAVAFWSLAAMAHAAVGSVGGFIAARAALGLGEAGNFPAAIKAVTDWFPRRERALAVGILNAGGNVGAMLTPLIVPAIVLTLGWRWAFIVTGGLGLFWLVAWLAIYRRPEETPQLSAAELAHIHSSPIEAGSKTPWLGLLRHRQTWAYAVGKFLTDPIWWLYLFWLPDFFSRGFHLDLKSFAIPLVVVYLAADVGSVGGGWLSSRLMKRGRSPNAARKLAMLVCALAVLPVVLAPRVHDVWTAVALISLAAAAHQGWSANLLTLPSDLFPGRVVSSVVGLGGMFGAIGGMLIAKVASAILQQTGSYIPIFLIAGMAYLVALLLIHLLVPRMQPAKLD